MIHIDKAILKKRLTDYFKERFLGSRSLRAINIKKANHKITSVSYSFEIKCIYKKEPNHIYFQILFFNKNIIQNELTKHYQNLKEESKNKKNNPKPVYLIANDMAFSYPAIILLEKY
ncbi:MAG: hypothetical protein FK734_03130 [Asgard group archaeon]|nr:hypothetical protein [Asgard group archaeon]